MPLPIHHETSVVEVSSARPSSFGLWLSFQLIFFFLPALVSAVVAPICRAEESKRQPSERGLHVPPEFAPHQHAVLLIHGIGSSCEALRPWQQGFEARGMQVLSFDYANDRSLATIGDRLSDDLKRFKERFPQVKLAIVAHSMGGLAARYALEIPGRDPGCVSELFLVGSPNHGSEFAQFQPHLEFAETIFLGGRYKEVLRPEWGKAADDLLPDSDFLKALNARPRNPAVRYHLAIGRRSFLRTSNLDEIAKEADDITKRGAADFSILAKLLRLDESKDGRGDGVVSIDRAKLDGVASEQMLDLNHCEMIVPSDEKPDGPTVVVEAVLRRLEQK